MKKCKTKKRLPKYKFGGSDMLFGAAKAGISAGVNDEFMDSQMGKGANAVSGISNTIGAVSKFVPEGPWKWGLQGASLLMDAGTLIASKVKENKTDSRWNKTYDPSNGLSAPLNFGDMAKYGGKLPKAQFGLPITQTPNEVQEFQGPSHAQGGIPVDTNQDGQAEIEVEGGETAANDYIYSDKIFLDKDGKINFDPKSGKSMADLSKKIESKYKGKEDKISKESKARELERLKGLNEKGRMIMEQMNPQSQANLAPMQQEGLPEFSGGGNTPVNNKQKLKQGLNKFASDIATLGSLILPDKKHFVREVTPTNVPGTPKTKKEILGIGEHSPIERRKPYTPPAAPEGYESPYDWDYTTKDKITGKIVGPLAKTMQKFGVIPEYNNQADFDAVRKNSSFRKPQLGSFPVSSEVFINNEQVNSQTNQTQDSIVENVQTQPAQSPKAPGAPRAQANSPNNQQGGVQANSSPSTKKPTTTGVNTKTNPTSGSSGTKKPAATKLKFDQSVKDWQDSFNVSFPDWQDSKGRKIMIDGLSGSQTSEAENYMNSLNRSTANLPTDNSKQPTDPELTNATLGTKDSLRKFHEKAMMDVYWNEDGTKKDMGKMVEPKEPEKKNPFGDLTPGDKAQLAGSAISGLYNIIKGSTKAEREPRAKNPYAQSAINTLQNSRFNRAQMDNDVTRSVAGAKANMRDGSRSVGAQMANLNKLAAGETESRGKISQMEQQFNMQRDQQVAQQKFQIGEQERQETGRVNTINAQNRGAKQAMKAAGFSNIGELLSRFGVMKNTALTNKQGFNLLAEMSQKYGYGTDYESFLKDAQSGKIIWKGEMPNITGITTKDKDKKDGSE